MSTKGDRMPEEIIPKSFAEENDQLPRSIPLNPYVSRLVIVEAILDGAPLKLLFDTGGGETYLTPEVIQRLGDSPSGRSIGFRMSGEIVESQYCHDITLTIGGIPFHHEEIGVWDVNAILPEGLPRLDGILSLKTFRDQRFSLNLSEKQLIFESKESFELRTENMVGLKSRIATGPAGSELSVFLRGSVGEEKGWFLLDSGNLDVLLVSQHLASGSPANGNAQENIWESDFKLLGGMPESARFRTKKMIYDGALSEEFMHDRIFSFDLSANHVWISPD